MPDFFRHLTPRYGFSLDLYLDLAIYPPYGGNQTLFQVQGAL